MIQKFYIVNIEDGSVVIQNTTVEEIEKNYAKNDLFTVLSPVNDMELTLDNGWQDITEV